MEIYAARCKFNQTIFSTGATLRVCIEFLSCTVLKLVFTYQKKSLHQDTQTDRCWHDGIMKQKKEVIQRAQELLSQCPCLLLVKILTTVC